MATGYLHPRYADSLSEFGQPLQLKRSGGWLLKRPILNQDGFDAMGPYPIFCCEDWEALPGDLQELGQSIVSIVLVSDPFATCDEAALRRSFPDQVIPFKHHFLRDLSVPLDSVIAKHHARNARIGLSQVAVERCSDPTACTDEWVDLYAVLTKRHQISGIRAFSRDSFAKQLAVPGIACFRARRASCTAGIILWYVQKQIAYYHLGAYTQEGYDLRASFALFDSALRHFASAGLRYASLGAGAGLGADADDGLSRFKRGWSTHSRPAYLCGRIFDREAYGALVRQRGIDQTSYFPAYRTGEFA